VWETSRTAGGWAQTWAWPGPQGEAGSLERGPQSLRVRQGGALARLLRDLQLDLRRPGPRGPRWLGRDGRRQAGPTTLSGLLGSRNLSLGEKLRMLGEPFLPAATQPDETLHAFFARRLGEGFAREALPALVAGLLAAPPERIGREALPRLRQLEDRGGLLFGSLRAGREHARVPVGGVGTLAQALAERLGCVHTERPARSLESLPEGRWRVHGDGVTGEVETLVLALPARAAATLLTTVAPAAANLLAGIPSLDLRVWHSRHALVPGWEGGIGLLVHPPEGRGLLGAVSFATEDPRGVPGLLQLRTYLGGAYSVAPGLETWPGVFQELRRWLPELGEPVQVREESCPGAFPLMEPGHAHRVDRLLKALPQGIHWLGAARFGPGIPDLAEGVESWARTAVISA